MNFRRSSVLALSALACVVVAQAQQSQTSGSVHGKISNRSGVTIAAKIIVRNLETGLVRTVSAGTDGIYSASLLPVGNYEITVTAEGMKTAKDSNVRITLGTATTMNFRLDVENAGSTVEVVAVSNEIDTSQVGTVVTFDQKAVEAVPLVTRNFTDMARLSPGVVAGTTSGNTPRLVVEGGRQIFNAIQIDGASNNSAFFNEQRGGAYTPFIFGADTIQELQIVTNGFDVQYGQAGATINAVTKTGTNEFGGSALLEVRRTGWSERPQAVAYDPSHTYNTVTNLQRYNNSTNVNFNAGGAIVKDQLWFFAGVERFHKSVTANPIPTSLSTTAGSGLTQADFDAMLNSPLGKVVTSQSGLTLAREFGNPGEGIAAHSYPMENTNTVYFGRLDYSLNERHRFVLRCNFQTMDDTLQNTSANPNNAESNNIPTKVESISWVGEANDIWTNNLLTESRLQIAREARPMRGNAAPGTPSITMPSGPGLYGMSFGTKTSTPRESNENTTQFFSATTWTFGDFQIKGGLDLMKVDVDNQFFNNNAGAWSFGTYKAAADWANGTLIAGPSVSYSGATSNYGGRILMGTKTEGFFGQVQYSGFFNKRLVLTAGVRTLNQSFTDNPHPNPNLKGLDQASGARSVDPRFAFSFDADGKGKTVVRGGYGSFTSPTPLLLHSNTMTGNGQIITNYKLSLSGATASTFVGTGALSPTNLINGTSLRKLTDAELLSLPAVTSSTSLWDPNNKLSRSKKTNLGVEHEFGQGFVVGLSGTYVKYENLQRFENINLAQTGGAAFYNDGYAPGIDSWSTLVRPNKATIAGRTVDFRPGSLAPGNPVGGFSDVYLVKTDGYGDYRGLSLTAKKTWNEKTGIMANITCAKAKDTGSFERGTYSSSNFPLTAGSELGASLTPDNQSPASNYGYGDSDRRWVMNAVGFFPIVFGVEGTVRALYQSGLPYSAYDGRDLNGDGAYIHFYGSHTRNDLRQPSYTQVDLRLSRVWQIYKKFQIEGIVDVYNLFNRADFYTTGTTANMNIATTGNPPNWVNNPALGQMGNVTKDKTRELQLGVRLKF